MGKLLNYVRLSTQNSEVNSVCYFGELGVHLHDIGRGVSSGTLPCTFKVSSSTSYIYVHKDFNSRLIPYGSSLFLLIFKHCFEVDGRNHNCHIKNSNKDCYYETMEVYIQFFYCQ